MKETDHDLLIKLSIDMKYVRTKIDEHIKRHGVWNYACAVAMLSLLAGLILAVVK